jgi:hypothetical protein
VRTAAAKWTTKKSTAPRKKTKRTLLASRSKLSCL